MYPLSNIHGIETILFSDTRVLILSDSNNVADIPETMLLKDVTNFNLPGKTLWERHSFARAFETEIEIAPELVIFYGFNDQTERDGMNELTWERNPQEASQRKIERYAERKWQEMEVILEYLDSRGIA